MVDVDDFIDVRECVYKDEHYSVRDNGAVMRHVKKGSLPRRYDNIWSFGNKNLKTGYMEFAGERVHRIVAFAFLGNPPTDQHVVDHIDTNRCNNRPENLRWVTKLENTLNNPITRAKIELICGSVEAFLNNPSLLNGYEKMDNNFSWMRAVSIEEAKISYDRLLSWSKEKPEPKGGSMGEWVFQNSNIKQEQIIVEEPTTRFDSHTWEHNVKLEIQKDETLEEDDESESCFVTESITPNALQLNWRTPTEFPCCPKEISGCPIENYYANLVPDAVFCKNKFYNSKVIEAAICEDGRSIYVMTQSIDEGSVKPWALSQIFFEDGIFYHRSRGTFFHEEGAKKYFTLAQGKEWTGGEVFDDFC